MGLSRKNSTNRRSIYCPINIYHHSSSNILNKTNPLLQSPASANPSPSCNITRAQSNRQQIKHHRSSICVINHNNGPASLLTSNASCGPTSQKCTINNLNSSQLELTNNLNSSLSLCSSLSPSPVTILHSPFRLSTPPSSSKNNTCKGNTHHNSATTNNNNISNNPLILCSNTNLNNCGYTGLNSSSYRLNSSSKLQLTPVAQISLSQSNFKCFEHLYNDFSLIFNFI